MNLPFDRLQTGQYLPGCRTHGRFARAEYAEGLWRVFVGVPTMTQTELDSFRGGEIRVAAALFGESLFFLLRFGDLAWVCAPFTPHGGSYASLPEEPGARMAFVFADSDSGVAQAIRVVSLSADAAGSILRACGDLRAKPYDRAESLKQQAAISREYPTGEDMLRTIDPAEVFAIAEKA